MQSFLQNNSLAWRRIFIDYMQTMAKLDKDGKLADLLRINRNLSKKLFRLDAVFNALHESVLVMALDNSISFANETAKKTLSMPDNFESYPIFKIIPDLKPDLDSVRSSLSPITKEFQISYPVPRYLKAYIVPLESEFANEEPLCVIILSDATKEKLSEKETIDNERINSILKLASAIAHEIGNPLNSMGIHLQLINRLAAKIDDEALKAKISDSIGICRSEISRLDSIVKNFLKAVRPQKALLIECDALKPLLETVKSLQAQLQDSNIAADIQVPSQLPTVFADEALLRQLYFNLLKNSIEAIGADGQITIKTSFDDAFLNLLFCDTGCGISAKDLTRIFEPYFTSKANGNGLGMLIVENIVKAHNGKISIESKVGRGTKITVSLRRAHPEIRQIQ